MHFAGKKHCTYIHPSILHPLSSHVLLAGSRGAIIIPLSNHVRVLEHCIVNGGQGVILGDPSCGGIRSEWPSEQQYERLRLVNFIVDPATRLLDTERAPFFL